MPTIPTAVLAYQCSLLIIFGTVCLMLCPKELNAIGLKVKLDDRQLVIYRICGLWVAASGVVSGLACTTLTQPTHRRQACMFFCAIHSIEVAIKMADKPKLSHAFANGHLALLLLIAAAFG